MALVNPRRLSRLPTKVVNGSLTIFPVARRSPVCHGPGVAQARATSGGIFIALGVLIGFVVGIVKGQPTIGVLAGTALGIAATLILWLVQTRKR